MAKRLDSKTRKIQILDAAIASSIQFGFQTVTRAQIAIAAGVTDGLVSKYLGTMIQARKKIMMTAIARGELNIIAQGLAVGNKYAKRAPVRLKTAALENLIN